MSNDNVRAISDIVKSLGNSRPIFSIAASPEYGLSLKLRGDCQYIPPYEEGEDVLRTLVVKYWQEKYDNENQRFVSNVNEPYIYNLVTEEISDLAYEYDGKWAKKCKLFGWLKKTAYEYKYHRNDLVALYRYVFTNIPKTRPVQAVDKIHVENMIAILKKMKEKDEGKD